MEIVSGFSLLDGAAMIWFFSLWIGYAQFAKYQAKRTDCLASVLHSLRIDWMQQLLKREIRVGDAALLSNLERNVSFLASTSILIVAGFLTALAGAEQVQKTLTLLPIAEQQSIFELELKLLLLIAVFVYAFFTFSWALRQFGFVAVLMGAAPTDLTKGEAHQRRFALSAAKVLDQAGHSYNYGLRAYYFALAMLSWFVSPWLMFATSTAVVVILYGREFHSATLQSMLKIETEASE